MARQVIEVVEATEEQIAAAVTRGGDSIMVGRRDDADPTASDLVTSGVVTEDQTSQVRSVLTIWRR